MKEWIKFVCTLILVVVGATMIVSAIRYCFFERAELKATITAQKALIEAYKEVKAEQDSIIHSYRLKEMYEVTEKIKML
ncbi:MULTISPECIES: hypothetical protein [Bacteroidales]|jgi:hypothetical protein|uniref:hypothetical protein n=1 Tax=Bacteroidales TaxID=171549 RepID=UPI0025B64DE2|nr:MULTISPECIES: hypothetical protein [Bacteroidales]